MTGKGQVRNNTLADQISLQTWCNKEGIKKNLSNRGGIRSSKMSKGRNTSKKVGNH